MMEDESIPRPKLIIGVEHARIQIRQQQSHEFDSVPSENDSVDETPRSLDQEEIMLSRSQNSWRELPTGVTIRKQRYKSHRMLDKAWEDGKWPNLDNLSFHEVINKVQTKTA